MSIYSIWKDSQPNQNQKDKMIRLIKNKLTPLSQTKKYPMGKQNFLHFKNLQKLPKLKKQPFHPQSRKSQIQDAILNAVMGRQFHKSQQRICEEIFQRQNGWIKLWKKTGDKFQKEYFTSRVNKCEKLSFPEETLYPADFRSKLRYRNSEHSSVTKMGRTVLKKVQILKARKSKLRQQKKPQSPNLKHFTQRNTQQNVETTMFLTENQPQTNEGSNLQKTTLSNKQIQSQSKKHDDWIYFLTKFIFEQHVKKSEEEKMYEQFTARKKQNRLKQFIGMFQRNNICQNSCHIAQNTQNHQKTCQQSTLFKGILQNQMNRCQNQKENEVATFNNPAVKLRKLQSICKSVENSLDISKQKRKEMAYTCSKIRINSNHKRIIGTNRPFCYAEQK